MKLLTKSIEKKEQELQEINDHCHYCIMDHGGYDYAFVIPGFCLDSCGNNKRRKKLGKQIKRRKKLLAFLQKIRRGILND